jgi:hypothetical protein
VGLFLRIKRVMALGTAPALGDDRPKKLQIPPSFEGNLIFAQ